MEKRNIIVIGASAGGFAVIKELVASLPTDLDAAIFIVWHMPPDVKGILPHALNKAKTLYAANAVDREPVQTGRIYVAPPDHHLLLRNGTVRISHGPKENRFRPAIDPLFRSAAHAYGPRVIGIVLSGSLDDGSAGLWSIKKHGGIAIVQDPVEAEIPSMPLNAIKAVTVDHIVPVAQMAELLTKLVTEEVISFSLNDASLEERTALEVKIAMEEEATKKNIMEYGELTPYTCPECHGVLAALQEGNRIRFRCHTGHAFSSDSLLATITEKVEETLSKAVRNIRESVMLLNHMGDHFAEVNQPKLAALYFQKAQEAENRVQLLRQAIEDHEHLSEDGIRQQAGPEEHQNGR